MKSNVGIRYNYLRKVLRINYMKSSLANSYMYNYFRKRTTYQLEQKYFDY